MLRDTGFISGGFFNKFLLGKLDISKPKRRIEILHFSVEDCREKAVRYGMPSIAIFCLVQLKLFHIQLIAFNIQLNEFNIQPNAFN